MYYDGEVIRGLVLECSTNYLVTPLARLSCWSLFLVRLTTSMLGFHGFEGSFVSSARGLVLSLTCIECFLKSPLYALCLSYVFFKSYSPLVIIHGVTNTNLEVFHIQFLQRGKNPHVLPKFYGQKDIKRRLIGG